ncbi:MAG: hypothetical protein M1832_000643 [Thelocarpon impressellum]|nr:MAG: hypothetical protein M1832_000643 [Thelocarpon impressellum]
MQLSFLALAAVSLAGSTAVASALPPATPSYTVADQSLDLSFDCVECFDFFPGPFLARTRPPHMGLNFSVGHAAPYPVLVNGVQIYPQSWRMAPEPLFAEVRVRQDHHTEDEASARVRLGYELETARPGQADARGSELVSLDFTVVQVAGRLSTAFPTVGLKVLQREGSQSEIVELEIKSGSSASSTPGSGAGQECRRLPLLCKWRAAIKAKMAKAKACHGRHRQAKQQHRHHGHHGHHGRRRGGFRRVFMHVVAPMLAGVGAALLASWLGVVLGQLLVRAWQRLYRGERGGYVVLEDAYPVDRKEAFAEQELYTDAKPGEGVVVATEAVAEVAEVAEVERVE